MSPWKIVAVLMATIIAIAVYLCFTLDFEAYKVNVEIPEASSTIQFNLYPKVSEFSLIMVGDVLLHSGVYKAAYEGNNKYDFKSMFEDVKPIIESHDLAFYNQESIIGGKNLGISSYPRFNSPDEIGDATIYAGFDLVSLANNHTFDKGEAGIKYSLEYWSKQENIITAGSYASEKDRGTIEVYEVNGITYAFLAYTTLTNGLSAPSGKEYLVNTYSEKKAKTDIASVRDKVDVVLVSIHWGTEYTLKQIDAQEEIAQFLADQDVDVVIGHHPHVVEPIEYIDNTLVIYSLGNFLSNQFVLGLDKAVGAMVSIKFQKIEDEDTTIINIANIKTTLTYNYKNSKGEYKIYPFDVLTNSILNNYEANYLKYKSVIMNLDSSMKVNALE